MNSETKCKENYDKKSCAQRGVIGREPMVRKCSSWAPRESVEEGKRRQRSFLGMSWPLKVCTYAALMDIFSGGNSNPLILWFSKIWKLPSRACIFKRYYKVRSILPNFFFSRCILFFSPLGSLPRFVVFFRHKAFHLRIGTTTIKGTSSFFLIPYICNFTFSSSSSAIYLSNFLCVSIRRKDLEQSKKSNWWRVALQLYRSMVNIQPRFAYLLTLNVCEWP